MNEKPVIIVDSREASANPRIVKKLGEKAEIKVEALPAGDYYINYSVIVERKTSLDLVNSVRDSRLWDELLRISSTDTDEKWLIVEGSLAQIRKFTHWREESILGIIKAIPSYGVKMVFLPSEYWTVLFLASFKIREKPTLHPLRVSERILSDSERLRYIVEGFPGVGAVLADNILKHFKTLRNFVNSNPNELMEIEGIGRKKAEEISKYFTLEYMGDET